MKMKKILLSSLAATSLLVACGGGGSNTGTPSAADGGLATSPTFPPPTVVQFATAEGKSRTCSNNLADAFPSDVSSNTDFLPDNDPAIDVESLTLTCNGGSPT